MKVENITHINLDELIYAICTGKTDKERKKELGSHINDLYNHISISFYLKEVNIVEAMYLKIFSNDNILVLSTIEQTDLIDKTKFKSMKMEVESLMKLIEIIQKDEDVGSSYEGTELLPAICLVKEMVVTFTGPSLGFLFGPRPDSLLQNIYSFKNDMDFNPTYIFEHIDVLNNRLILNLINQTYKNMINRELSIDLLVDATINGDYYDYISLDQRELSHVNTPFGSLHFIGENISSEMLASEIDEVKKGYSLLPNNARNQIFAKTKLFFEISTSYYAFLEMFLALPNHFFSDYMDPKILLNSSSFNFMVHHKYNVRIHNHFSKLVQKRNEIAENPEFKLEKYFFSLLNTEMKFTLSLTLEEVSLVLNSYKDNIISNNIYGKNESFLVIDILRIIETVEKKAKLVYQLIS